MSHDPLSVTKRYFALSNQADLDAISALFDDQSTYSSKHTGIYFGRQEIMRMMQGYFHAHQSLQWHIDDINAIKSNVLVVDFTCNIIDSKGLKTTRTGVEILVVSAGIIRHIEIK